MKLKSLNKILYPVYIYIILFGIYNFYISELLYSFNSDLLTDIIYYNLIIVYPILSLILININLKKIFKKVKYYTVFLFSALPGFITGVWLGYGLYSANMYPATTYGLACALIQIGIIGAVISGTLGVLMILSYASLKKIFKKSK